MQKEASELKAFLLHGVLGMLTPQCSRDEVIALLGTPDSINERELGAGEVQHTFVYGNLLLYFIQTSMVALEIDMRLDRHSVGRRPDMLRTSLGVSWYPWLVSMTASTFTQYLKSYQIPARKAIIDLPDLPDEGLSQLVEIQGTRMTVLFDEKGIIEQVFYAPASNAHYRYEELT